MKETVKKYLNKIEEINNNKKINNKEEILNDLLTHIKFFQHERLIHLIVTFFTGIAAIIFLISFISLENIYIGLLFLIVFVLFVPYIFHYYFLENSIQKLYNLYFEIKEK